MAIEALFSLPTDVETLLDRLTSTRAGYLDNLASVTLSSRASSTEVAKAASWTSALATKLNTNVDVTLSSIDTKIDAINTVPTVVTGNNVSTTSAVWADMASSTQLPLPFAQRGTSSAAGWATLYDSGTATEGYCDLIFFVVRNSAGGSREFDWRVSYDGSYVYNPAAFDMSGGTYWFFMMSGHGGFYLSDSGVPISYAPGMKNFFTDRLLIESYGETTDVQRYGFYNVVRTA